MANTASSVFSAAITFTVQSKVLENLRSDLVYANPALAEQGRFDPMSDQIMFTAIPDLSNTTPQTPLTEGTKPTARALSFSVVSFSTAEYGDLVDVTNVAKIKGPQGIIDTAVERTTRVSKEVIDVITRDTIATGGTPFYPTGSVNTVRTDIASTEKMVGADLIVLRGTMKKNKIPLNADGTYHLYAAVQQTTDLKKETTSLSSWLSVGQYLESAHREVINGEIGRLHGFTIIEVNNAPTFSSTTTVYASFALGSVKGWGAGELETFKSYHVAPGGDHSDPLGQLEEVGWRVNFGVGVLSNSYYYRFETAATTL